MSRAHQSIQCPRCYHTAECVTLAALELDLCDYCRGLWFDRDELRRFGEAVAKSDAVIQQEVTALLEWLRSPVARPSHTSSLPCPVCRTTMSSRNYGAASGVVVYRCAQHGTWADREIALRIVQMVASGDDKRIRELAAARRTQSRSGAPPRKKHDLGDLDFLVDLLDVFSW